jgi:hypothetical protein
MEKNYNFLTLGRTCKPAAVLRHMDYREFALPFDWVQSSINSFEKCFKDGFRRYHCGLQMNNEGKRLIDVYGFEFPHDYPTEMELEESEYITENKIVKDWDKYYSKNVEKYSRRIERFLEIVRSKKPIIILCDFFYNDVIKLRELLKTYYNKDNVFFINSTPNVYEEDVSSYNIINIYTERNGKWNDIDIWKPVVERVINQIPPSMEFS